MNCQHADGRACLFCHMGLPVVRVHPAAALPAGSARRTLTIAATARVVDTFGDPRAYSSPLALEFGRLGLERRD